MDWIDEELDEIEHLNSLTGDEYVAEAQRLGFVVTEKGLFFNPDHPTATSRPASEWEELVKRQFERHGRTWEPDPHAEPTS